MTHTGRCVNHRDERVQTRKNLARELAGCTTNTGARHRNRTVAAKPGPQGATRQTMGVTLLVGHDRAMQQLMGQGMAHMTAVAAKTLQHLDAARREAKGPPDLRDTQRTRSAQGPALDHNLRIKDQIRAVQRKEVGAIDRHAGRRNERRCIAKVLELAPQRRQGIARGWTQHFGECRSRTAQQHDEHREQGNHQGSLHRT